MKYLIILLLALVSCNLFTEKGYYEFEESKENKVYKDSEILWQNDSLQAKLVSCWEDYSDRRNNNSWLDFQLNIGNSTKHYIYIHHKMTEEINNDTLLIVDLKNISSNSNCGALWNFYINDSIALTFDVVDTLNSELFPMITKSVYNDIIILAKKIDPNKRGVFAISKDTIEEIEYECSKNNYYQIIKENKGKVVYFNTSKNKFKFYNLKQMAIDLKNGKKPNPEIYIGYLPPYKRWKIEEKELKLFREE